jgi:DNA replication protein DnaC
VEQMMINQTADKLRTMRLSAMAAEYIRQSESQFMSALDFDVRVGMMVDAEWLSSEDSRINRLIKAAKLRFPAACFADIDYRSSRKLERSVIARLSDFSWVREARNVIITGATGCGKTWLSCAFGAEACRMGLSVAFYRTSRLMNDMALAAGIGGIEKLLAKLKKTHILILDDWGLSTLNALEGRFLLEAFEDRYNERSTLLSAQVPVAQWHDLFEDSTIADAVLDRLVHNAHRITLHGHSLRAGINQVSVAAPCGAQSQNTYLPDGEQGQNTYPQCDISTESEEGDGIA